MHQALEKIPDIKVIEGVNNRQCGVYVFYCTVLCSVLWCWGASHRQRRAKGVNEFWMLSDLEIIFLLFLFLHIDFYCCVIESVNFPSPLVLRFKKRKLSDENFLLDMWYVGSVITQRHSDSASLALQKTLSPSPCQSSMSTFLFSLNKSTYEKEIINMITAHFIFKNITTRKGRRRKLGKLRIFRSIFENNYLQFVFEGKVCTIRMMENDGEEKVSFLQPPMLLPLSHSFRQFSFVSVITTTESIISREKQQTAKAKLMDKIILHFFHSQELE